MNREFLINILFLISINLLIKPFYIFGIDRTVQNVVGAEDYGIYFVLLNFTFLFQIINDFGIQNFNNRQIARHRQLLDKYLPNILILKLFQAFTFLGVIALAGWALGYTLHYPYLLAFVAVNQILVALVFYLRTNISGLGKYRLDSLISVLDRLLMIFICAVLLWGPSFKNSFRIEWFVLAQTLSLSLTALIAFSIVWKFVDRLHFKINIPFLIHLLKESLPFALIIFLMTAYTRIDSVMIEQILPDGKLEAGIYASAYRLLDASNMIGYLFAGLLLPMFSRMIKDREPIIPLVKQSFQMIWAGALTLAIGVWFFQSEIMILLYIEATPYWGEVLGYLMFSFIAVSGTYIIGTLLTANNSLRKMNIIFIVSIFLNILLNYLLIPTQKASGAAIATLGTQSFAFLAQLYLAKKEFDFKIDYWLLTRITIFTILLILSGYLLYATPFIIWYWQFLLYLTSGILLAIILRMIDFSALTSWIKERKT